MVKQNEKEGELLSIERAGAKSEKIMKQKLKIYQRIQSVSNKNVKRIRQQNR